MDDHRVKLIAGGERAGKSYSAAMELFAHVIGHDGLWWIVSPDYEQAWHEYKYVLDALNKLGMVSSSSFPRVGQCSLMTVFGGEVVTKSADDVRKLAGAAPNGILLCEAAQTDFEVWMKLRGRLSEKKGWLWASGTFEGSLGWYPQLWTRWQADNPEGGKSFSIPTWANLAIFPGGRDDPEIKALEATYPADLFMERCGAIPCVPAEIVFHEFDYTRHVTVLAKYDDKSPVELAIDPGYASAYYVGALQWHGDHVYLIDELYEQGKVAEQVIALCKRRLWWKSVRGGVIDTAGKQHPGAKSQVEIWQSEAGLWLRTNRVSIVDGILRMRTFLVDPGSADGKPRLHFSPTCKGVLAEFSKYKYAKDADNKPISELPIDRDNHGIKAISYWLYDRYGPVLRKKRKPRPGHNPFAGGVTEPAWDVDIERSQAGVRFGKRKSRVIAVPLSFKD